jgi:predicted dinucleotide-binding enzyme
LNWSNLALGQPHQQDFIETVMQMPNDGRQKYVLSLSAWPHFAVSGTGPETLKRLVKTTGPKARAGKVAEAIAFGDVVIMSLPMKAFNELDAETKQALKGKIVIDTSNPYPERDGAIAEEARREPGGTGSFVARLLPGARIVRAFNTVYFKDLRKTTNKEGERSEFL